MKRLASCIFILAKGDGGCAYSGCTKPPDWCCFIWCRMWRREVSWWLCKSKCCQPVAGEYEMHVEQPCTFGLWRSANRLQLWWQPDRAWLGSHWRFEPGNHLWSHDRSVFTTDLASTKLKVRPGSYILTVFKCCGDGGGQISVHAGQQIVEISGNFSWRTQLPFNVGPSASNSTQPPGASNSESPSKAPTALLLLRPTNLPIPSKAPSAQPSGSSNSTPQGPILQQKVAPEAKCGSVASRNGRGGAASDAKSCTSRGGRGNARRRKLKGSKDWGQNVPTVWLLPFYYNVYCH